MFHGIALLWMLIQVDFKGHNIQWVITSEVMMCLVAKDQKISKIQVQKYVNRQLQVLCVNQYFNLEYIIFSVSWHSPFIESKFYNSDYNIVSLEMCT